jgi:hemerythrin-like domain-containing protein
MFKWHIEKHLFVEERAIFSSLKVDKDIGEELNLFFELSKQHTEIINEIKKLYKNLKNDIDIDTIKLRDLLNQHLNFEEKVAYPKLDEIITETEKNLLLNQIQDIIYEV